jgi:hypothetical protein
MHSLAVRAVVRAAFDKSRRASKAGSRASLSTPTHTPTAALTALGGSSGGTSMGPAAPARPALEIRGMGTTFGVADLTKHLIEKPADLYRLMKLGGENRTTSETEQNATSSRSHAMMTLILEQKMVSSLYACACCVWRRSFDACTYHVHVIGRVEACTCEQAAVGGSGRQ